jgi:heterodisulfide reductase subunit B
MDYALFLGCVIPTREPSYEFSVRSVMKRLGIELNDLKGATCCAPIPIESLDHTTSLAITAYNLCLAEEADLDLMPLCNGCYQALSKANVKLKNDEKLKASTNEILSKTGKKYQGTIEVKDYLQVLYNDVGIETITKHITNPFKDLRTAVFYGCHLLKPSSILTFDDPERPHYLDELVELTGATSVPYMHKTRCCGGLLRGVSEELADKLARDKLYNITDVDADCIVTVCPFCFLQLDTGQLIVNRKFDEPYHLPVLHYPELLNLAMGMDPKDIGLQTHRIRTDSIMNKIG